MCLVPKVRREIDLPLIAAGGIGTGRAMLAAMNLGADGVQIGSRFVASEESSAHEAFKRTVVETQEGGTKLTLKEITPVRLIRNPFFNEVEEAYANCATHEQLKELLGRGRAKRGMFEGDLKGGELEIGQVSALIDDIKPAAQILDDILREYRDALSDVRSNQQFDF